MPHPQSGIIAEKAPAGPPATITVMLSGLLATGLSASGSSRPSSADSTPAPTHSEVLRVANSKSADLMCPMCSGQSTTTISP